MAIKKAKKMSKPTKKIMKSKAMPSTSKRMSAVDKTFTKSEILGHISECTNLAKTQINSVFEILHQVIESHLKKGAPGVFVMPGLLKIHVINKPATKARKGINPFTGEETMFKAKPARKVVRVKALKRLKEMV